MAAEVIKAEEFSVAVIMRAAGAREEKAEIRAEEEFFAAAGDLQDVCPDGRNKDREMFVDGGFAAQELAFANFGVTARETIGVVVAVEMKDEAELADVIRAGSAAGAFFGSAQRRSGKADEDNDDGDHHEKLDDGER